MSKTKKAKNIKGRVIGILAMIFAVAFFVLFMQEFYLRRIDHNNIRLEGFYLEDRDSLDVVLIGASGVYSGYNAGEAYKLYGITSYPYCFQFNPVGLWKYEIKDVLERQSPELLIIDLNGVTYGKENKINEADVRNLTDVMPWSENKIDLINSLGTEEKLSYYLPIMKYHSAFHYRSAFDILDLKKRGYAILRGAFTHTYTNDKALQKGKKHGRKKWTDNHGKELRKIGMSSDETESLKEILNMLDECDIPNVLFIRLPQISKSRFEELRKVAYDEAAEMVTSVGFDYLDLNDYLDEMNLDGEKDFFDPGHMVAPGQKKLTDFLSGYIVKKYNLKGDRLKSNNLSEKQLAEWEKSAEYTEKYYRLYDWYRTEHSDVHERDYNFKDDVETLHLLDNM